MKLRIPGVVRSGVFSVVVTTGLAACADVPRHFGTTPEAARVNAQQFLGAMTNRFTNVVRSPRYERAREQLGRYALTPSVIFGDTSIWTSMSGDSVRTLFGDAEFTGGRYVFTNAPSPSALSTPADGRHIMRLQKLAKDDEYEWVTGVDFAVGSIQATDIHAIFSALLASAEGRSSAQLRTDYRSAFPHTTQALGRLFTIDTIASVKDAQGGNSVTLGLRLTTNTIRGTYPKYAEFLDKYIKKIRLQFSLSDPSGVKWFDLTGRDGYFVARVRSANGKFAPLNGAIRPIPDSLAMTVDATVKVKVFTVGVSKLRGQWINLQRPNERSWVMRFTREPEWVLPPIVAQLIRSPLRRPFEGDGMYFKIGFRDTPNGQTLMSRQGILTVKESAILRFLGKLGGAAMGDFVSQAEVEENKFNATVFAALRSDIDALLK